MTDVNRQTGELHDGIDEATARAMRDCDEEISRLDKQIDDTKGDLKELREEREAAITRLRDYARGTQALPFGGE